MKTLIMRIEPPPGVQSTETANPSAPTTHSAWRQTGTIPPPWLLPRREEGYP